MAIFKLRSIHSNNDVSIFCDCRRQKSMIVDRLIHSKQKTKKNQTSHVVYQRSWTTPGPIFLEI